MARPSVKAERTAEILDAFERCVARLGIEGTTLERIAEESGMRRSLLRYHIGNRDALVQALADRYIETSKVESEKLLAAMPPQNKADALLSYLFGEVTEQDSCRILVAGALVVGAGIYPSIKDRMVDWYKGFVSLLASVIASEFPATERKEIYSVAWGITSILLNSRSLSPIGADQIFHQDSLAAAKRLMASLKVPEAALAV